MSEDPARGERIRHAMFVRNFSKTQALARELNVSVAAISRWQNGGHVSLQRACEFAARLDVSLDWLLLDRGSLDWHKHDRVTAIEMQFLESVRDQPAAIRTALRDLVEALASSRQLR
ncbi:helix-turn-helix domain-containing protein [Ancylobacter sp. IITR112]|uniref:helix-turn-helix domain-containing protein n=1 Tax=Ancylobacter sp. IITR112 TaxID=3138073 RepID=UPI00352AE13E